MLFPGQKGFPAPDLPSIATMKQLRAGSTAYKPAFRDLPIVGKPVGAPAKFLPAAA